MAEAWKLPVSPKQLKFVQLCHPRPKRPKYVLCSGPRFSTKTVGCLNALVDNAWNINNSHWAVISPTVSAGEDSGSWTLLTEHIIPAWVEGDFGMKWKTKPRQKGTTKRLYCEVTNMHGGVSTFQLESLQREKDVEAKFKNKSFSGIYMPEMSYFKSRTTFDIIIECLRGSQWNEDDFLFVGDTNPAEEGEKSWIYQLWFVQAKQKTNDPVELAFIRNLASMTFSVADNIFVSKERLDEQFAKYRHNPDLMDRYFHGKWKAAAGDGIFMKHFRPSIHVVGGYEIPAAPPDYEPEILVPEENCFELITGSDIGATNHGFTIMEKCWRKDVFKSKVDGVEVEKEREVSLFKVLDEVVHIDIEEPMEKFVDECLEKMEWWENFLGRPISWRHWSDRSAFDKYEPIANLYHHQLVYAASKGRIVLQAADRSSGSVLQRIDITKRIMFENRLFVCRSRCPNLIESLQSLRQGKTPNSVQKGSIFKHAWDAFTYAVASECYDELLNPRSDVNTGKSSDGVVMLKL